MARGAWAESFSDWYGMPKGVLIKLLQERVYPAIEGIGEKGAGEIAG